MNRLYDAMDVFINKLSVVIKKRNLHSAHVEDCYKLGGYTSDKLVEHLTNLVESHINTLDANVHNSRESDIDAETIVNIQAHLDNLLPSSYNLPYMFYGGRDDTPIDYVIDGWTINMPRVPGYFRGIDFIFPSMPISVSPSLTNKTLYLYAEYIGYLVAQNTQYDSIDDRLRIGTIKTGTSGITQVNIDKAIKINGHLLGVNNAPKYIPLSGGYSADTDGSITLL